MSKDAAEKLDPYDLLGVLVPGTLLLCWLPICFPSLLSVAGPKFPEAFGVVALTAAAVFLGQITQALSSFIEPILFATWGGQPSVTALRQGLGDRYLPKDAAKRIEARLVASIGDQKASPRSLFLHAMHKALPENPRVERFNALYAYHRALVVLVLVGLASLMASMASGAAASWSFKHWLVLAGASLLVLAWARARQRSYYYVREVLLTANRVIEGGPGGDA